MTSYEAFLESKRHTQGNFGFEPEWIPDKAFGFQQHAIRWAVNKGRGMVGFDCGMGKTLIQETFAENVRRKTGGNVLLLTPLAVGAQAVAEGEKFGIECHRSKGEVFPITVTNYEQLHHFNPSDFQGVVADESSCLKNFDGVLKAKITAFCRKIPYRLLCSATPSPNDFIELGTSSEALGDLGYMDMLSKYFKNDQNSNHPNRNWSGGAKWRFRGHSQTEFWRWVCSWARMARKPSDLGFSDEGFQLPDLIFRSHSVSCDKPTDGFLFALPACGLKEERAERRRTLQERCEMAARLAGSRKDPSLIWVNLDDEAKLVKKLTPDCVEVHGSDSVERKEEVFMDFAAGKIPNLVTKYTIAGFGLNFQNCAHQVHFPNHSYEQRYQSIRRSWRFGQKNQVTIDDVTSDGEQGVTANLDRKAKQMDIMFSRVVELMNHELAHKETNKFTKKFKTPK